MEFKTEAIHLLVDRERGVQRVAGALVAEAWLGPLSASATFRRDGRRQRVPCDKPTAVLDENGAVEVTYLWRGDTPTDRVLLRVWYELEAAPTPHAGLLIRAQLINESPQPLELDSIDPLLVRADGGGTLQLGHTAADWSILRHGYQSWSATRMYRTRERQVSPRFDWLAAMEENLANLSPSRAGVFVSEQVSLIRNVSSGQSLTAGFLTCRRAFGDFRLHCPGQGGAELYRARCRFDGIRVEPGQRVETEPLWVSFGGRHDDPLRAWATRSGQAMQARVPAKAPVGWCSWYYYYTAVTQRDVIANLEKLAPLRERLHLDTFQLDDGYQSRIGDWLIPNEKFPDGLPWLVEKIKAAGFVPGIWTAPFTVDRRSRLAQEHPDWLLRHPNGTPVRGVYNPNWNLRQGMWTLDPSHPQVQAWLTATFRELRAMGWHFFKIDFLYSAALPAVRHDARSTRASALRAGLEAIRRGIGDDATLLGCGCPLHVAVGLCDLMRIGPDVTPIWGNPMRWAFRDPNCLCTRHATRNTIHRAFLDRRWWINDPDCVLAREKKNKLTLAEIQTFAAVAAVSGGMFLLSDDMTQYSPERFALIEKALACRTEGMRVLDADAGEYPSRMIARTADGYFLLVINWRNKEAAPLYDLRECLTPDELGRIADVTDVWQEAPLRPHDGLLRLGGIAPHGCRLLKIRLHGGKDHG
jgi:alpha-galactosidase